MKEACSSSSWVARSTSPASSSSSATVESRSPTPSGTSSSWQAPWSTTSPFSSTSTELEVSPRRFWSTSKCPDPKYYIQNFRRNSSVIVCSWLLYLAPKIVGSSPVCLFLSATAHLIQSIVFFWVLVKRKRSLDRNMADPTCQTFDSFVSFFSFSREASNFELSPTLPTSFLSIVNHF